MKKQLKVLELFAGIGACSKALERLKIKYEIVDAVEIDKYAIKSFNAIHNTNFEPQDITTWDKDIEVDLIMHGSPCQDFSLAGKQAGGDKDSGTRSSLMYETIRIVEKLKPKYVIWENVKNLLSKKHRHNFDAYLKAMNDLGYISDFMVLNAKDYGIPQNRERVFTISIKTDIYDFVFPPKQDLKLKLSDMLENEVDERYYLSDKMINYCMGINQKESKFPRKERFLQSLNTTNNKNIATTISTNAGNRPVDNFIIDNRNMKEKLCDYLIQNNMVKENDVIRHSYSTSRMQEWKTRNIEKNNEVPTLDTRCDCLGVVQKTRIRKLTPKECWRLMGFEDDDFNKASKVNSNAQLYKQAGNSIVVNVLEAILSNLLDFN